MDGRPYVLLAALGATLVAAGCDRQAEEARYATAGMPVKGTEKPQAIVPANPDPDKDHGNAAAQKGGSPHAGTGEPTSQH